MTILGETRDGQKVTQTSPRILPEVVIYDVDLTLTLPPAISGTSGINAIAHAVEALYAQDRNPLISIVAKEGVRALAGALPIVVERPADREARSDALYGAALRDLPRRRRHGPPPQALPHAWRLVRSAARRDAHGGAASRARLQRAEHSQVMRQLAEVLGTDDPARGLYDLAGRVGLARPEGSRDARERHRSRGRSGLGQSVLERARWNVRRSAT